MVESRFLGERPLFLGVSAPLAGAVLALLVAVVTVVLLFPVLDTRLDRVVAAVSATGLRALLEGCSFALVSATVDLRFLGGIAEQ